MIKKKLKVSVITVLYNEEKRVEGFLENMKWSNEVIVLEKCSTDRTRELALKYTPHVYSIQHTEGGDGYHLATQYVSNDWIYHATAAGLIHPKLIDRIEKLLSLSDFPFDVIEIPYKIYALGIHSPYSPWYTSHKPTLIRKSAFRPSQELHKEASYIADPTRVYKMNWEGDDETQYHLTHVDLNDFFSKHLRYTKFEAEFHQGIPARQELRRSFFEIIKSIAVVILKRRSYLFGWDGIALGIAYVSYFIMKFLFVWEKHRKNQTGLYVYPEIKAKILNEWKSQHYE